MRTTTTSGLALMERLTNVRKLNLMISKPSTAKLSTAGLTYGSTMTKPTEVDPNGKKAHEPGAKLDAGKSPMFRGALSYFPRAMEQLALLSAVGARKYAWKGWESVPDGINRYSDGLVRHLAEEGKGEDVDPDTGLLHATAVFWNAGARLELMLRERENRG